MQEEASNDVISYKKTMDKIVFRLLREAVNEADVQKCLVIFHKIEQSTTNEKFRILVDTRLIDIGVKNIRWTVVNSIGSHFKDHLTEYLRHISKCAVLVSSDLLASVFQKVIDLIVQDRNLVCVTSKLDVAHTFLK